MLVGLLLVNSNTVSAGNNGNGHSEVADPGNYSVSVWCEFDAAGFLTHCTFTGLVANADKDISHFVLTGELCAVVVDGTAEFSNPDPTTGAVGYKFEGDWGTLTFAGQVQAGGWATYWFKAGTSAFAVGGLGITCLPDETPTETPSETPTETSTETPSETPTAAPAGDPDLTPTATPEGSPSIPSETPSETPTQEASPTATTEPEATSTPTEEPAESATSTPDPTGTPDEDATPSPTATETLNTGGDGTAPDWLATSTPDPSPTNTGDEQGATPTEEPETGTPGGGAHEDPGQTPTATASPTTTPDDGTDPNAEESPTVPPANTPASSDPRGGTTGGPNVTTLPNTGTGEGRPSWPGLERWAALLVLAAWAWLTLMPSRRWVLRPVTRRAGHRLDASPVQPDRRRQ